MINRLQRKYIIILFVVLFTSCIPPLHDAPKDPRTFENSDTDLFELGSSLPYFVDFMHAIDKTHLAYLLEESGPYTVFMPNQWAFSRFRMDNKINHTDQFPDERLTEILLYHFIEGRWMLSNIPEGYHSTLLREKTTGNPIDLYIEKDGVFRINGLNTIDEPDLEAINGFIQSIKSVLYVPTILDHLTFNNEFSLILEMLNRKDPDLDFSDLLSQDGPSTFFAPGNEAILSIIEDNQEWQTINDIPDPTLNKIIKNHLVSSENIVLKEITQNNKLTSMLGNDFTIQPDNRKWSIIDMNGKVAHITLSDIQGSNGVIHRIDKVLLP